MGLIDNSTKSNKQVLQVKTCLRRFFKNGSLDFSIFIMDYGI